jgi:hypothetical protein
VERAPFLSKWKRRYGAAILRPNPTEEDRMVDRDSDKTAPQTSSSSLRDTASVSAWHVLRGTGLFDVSFERPNRDGWHIYEAGQRQFWAVEEQVDWNAPWDEDPEVARHAAAMLAFLCPGEKAAVTGASLISTQVRSEEAKFYFAEQALEEAKHYEALRRLVPAMTGRPFPEPSVWVRALFSYGVLDPNDLPFMMSNINVVGEHLANQIFRKIKPAVRDEKTLKILNLIGKDESRHIAAGERFWPQECGDRLGRFATTMAVKNATTTVLLLLAAYDLVGPMEALGIDLGGIMENMLSHFDSVTGSHRGASSAFLTILLRFLQKLTPGVIHAIGKVSDADGNFDFAKVQGIVEHAMKSPRYLFRLTA